MGHTKKFLEINLWGEKRLQRESYKGVLQLSMFINGILNIYIYIYILFNEVDRRLGYETEKILHDSYHLYCFFLKAITYY